MAAYRRSGVAHTTYGSADINGQLHPVWEAAGIFGQAIGPALRSAGYPSPATLPPSIAGEAGTVGGSRTGWNWGLFWALVVVSVIGFAIVHHLHWRA